MPSANIQFRAVLHPGRAVPSIHFILQVCVSSAILIGKGLKLECVCGTRNH